MEIKIQKILTAGLYLILLLPLVFTSFTFFPWHFGKTMIFQILVEVLVVLWLVMAVRANSRSPLQFKKLNFLDWSILLFLAIITLTSLTGVNPANSFWGNQARANGVFTWWHFGAFYFLLVWLFKNGRSFFSIAVLVAVLASLTALFPNLLPTAWQAASGGGIIGNRAFLASYLVLATGLSLYLFVNYKNKWRWPASTCARLASQAKRVGQGGLFLAAPILFIYTIIDTGNRGAMVGLMAGIWLGLLISFFVLRTKKIKTIILILFLLLNSCFLILYSLRQNPTFQRALPRLSNLANISLSSGTSETRLMAWESAWQGIKERPLRGWGWGNYGVVFDKYYNSQFLKHGFTETVWDKPHNWLLEIGVTAGILGMIGYLGIYFFAIYYLLKKNIILSATLLAYFIAGLFLFETTNSLILWFLILAFVSSMSVIPRFNRGIQDGSKSLDSPIKSGNDKVRWLFVFSILLLISYLLSLNFHFLKSSYYMRQAELSTALMDWTGFATKALAVGTSLKPVPTLSENAVFLAEQLTKFDKAGLPRLRSAEAGAIVNEKTVENTALQIAGVLEGASSKYPDNLSFPVWAGQVYLVLGEKMDERYFGEAERVLLAAEKISPQKQEVLFLLGRLYLLKKDFDRALSFQKKAIEVAPEINTSHWFLGLTYVAQGERAKGLEEIEKAMELGYNLTKDQKLYVLDLYGLEKDYAKLIEEYKKLIESEPENVNWYVKLAAVYAESGDKKAALEITRQVINLYPPIKAEAEEFIKKYKLE